jgi:hypothetical protein
MCCAGRALTINIILSRRDYNTGMPHDAAATQRYIDDALRRFLPFKDAVDRNARAFAYLRGLRRRGDEPLLKQYNITVPDDPKAPFDESLGDAEHYMYARYLASSTGDPSVKALVTGYEVKKYIDSKRGKLQDARTNPKFPVLPPSQDSVRWGLKGADDGLQDYRDAHNGQTGPLGSAIKANQDFIKGMY